MSEPPSLPAADGRYQTSDKYRQPGEERERDSGAARHGCDDYCQHSAVASVSSELSGGEENVTTGLDKHGDLRVCVCVIVIHTDRKPTIMETCP